ncbi:PUA-like domain-containing protein [Peziza echinospora]|nr:PUA-like domain-containing protein [Peziza echinospora]
MSTEYELQRQKNIANNLAILASLGLEKPAAKAAPTPAISLSKTKKKKKEKVPSKPKVKAKHAESEEAGSEEADKENLALGMRKSKRIAAAAAATTSSRKRKTHHKGDISSDSNTSDSDPDEDHYRHSDSDTSDAAAGPRGVYGKHDKPGLPRRVVNGRYVAHLDPSLKHLRPNPKTFGAVRNVPVGTWWSMRQEASVAGVHAPFVAGIFGTPAEGTYSVALSGGYEDDIDEGFRFTYTGSGGRELKAKNLRTAPQSKDQQLEKGNAALVRSFETGLPVRVIRGYKGDKRWAPRSGYRYDGLYQVVKWWKEKGLAGYLVYKYAFKRVDGQVPIDLSAGPVEEEEEEDEEEEGGGGGGRRKRRGRGREGQEGGYRRRRLGSQGIDSPGGRERCLPRTPTRKEEEDEGGEKMRGEGLE